jgi:hypothetical protein
MVISCLGVVRVVKLPAKIRFSFKKVLDLGASSKTYAGFDQERVLVLQIEPVSGYYFQYVIGIERHRNVCLSPKTCIGKQVAYKSPGGAILFSAKIYAVLQLI